MDIAATRAASRWGPSKVKESFGASLVYGTKDNGSED